MSRILKQTIYYVVVLVAIGIAVMIATAAVTQ